MQQPKLKNYDQVKKVAQDIETDSLLSLWSELGFVSGHSDGKKEEHHGYIIGKEISGDQ